MSGPVGQLIRVGVFISGSDGLNAIDITLLANHTFARPFGVDLAGSVLLGTPVTVLLCVGGALKSGSVCSSTDSPDTLHLAATNALGTGLTTAPTTGLLFTAIYNITGTTASGGIPIGFQTGCSQTSVSGGVCVTIPNGGSSPDSETVQAATFDDSTSSAMMSVVVTSNALSFGPQFPGATNTVTLTATAQHGYPGLATDNVAFSIIPVTGITATFSPASCTTTGSTCTSTLTLTAPSAGTFIVTVLGTYQTLDAAGNPDTLSSTVTISVIVWDFGFSVSPTSVSVHAGTTGTADVTVTSLNGFAATVTLTSQVIGALTVSFSQNPIDLTAGAVVVSTAIFSSSTVATDHAIIRGTASGRTKASPTMTVTVSVAPDFSLTATPATVSPMISGVAGSSVITVKPVDGFTGTVTLTNSTGSLGLGCSLAPTSLTFSGQTNLNSTLSCTGSAAGSYIVRVKATNGTLAFTHSVFVYFTIQDFTVDASPSPVTFLAGTSGSSTVTITYQSFTGTVDLTTQVSPLTGLTCSVSPNSVTATGTSTLSCSGVTAGVYTVSVNATSGSLKHSATVTFVVVDFTMSANPSTVSFAGSSSGTTEIQVGALQGFTGTVTLATFQLDPSLTVTFTPSSGAVSVPGNANATISGATIGDFNVNITGTSGSLVHFVIVTVHVLPIPDFKLSANPSSVVASPGSRANSTITTSSLNGFVGTIDLTNSTSSPDLTCSISPKTVTFTGSGSQDSTLSCTGSPGSYTIEVDGNNGTVTRKVTVDIVIQEFTVVASSPAAVNVGASVVSKITVTSVGGLTGTVSLTAVVPAGLTCGAITPGSVTLGTIPQNATVSCSSSTAANYSVTFMAVSSGPVIKRNATATFAFVDFTISASASSGPVSPQPGDLANFNVTVTGVNGFGGEVALTATSSAGLKCTVRTPFVTGSGTSNVQCGSANIGDYTVTVTGTIGSLSHTTGSVAIKVWDFSFTITTQQITIEEGGRGTITYTFLSDNNFAGTITLVAGVVPGPGYPGTTKPAVSLDTYTVTLAAGGSQTVTATVTVDPSVLPHLFGVSVNATSGLRVQAVTPVSITVPDPNVSYASNPGSLVTGPGGSISSTLTLTSSGNVSGLVALSLTVSPTGSSCSLSRSSVKLDGDKSNTTSLTCSGALGSYTVSIDGAVVAPHGGTIHPTGSIKFTVADFSISSTPTSILDLQPNQVAHASITITWQSSYNGTVSFTLVPDAGLNATIRSSSLTGAGSVTIDVSSAVGGTYSLKVKAMSGSAEHDLTLTVGVQTIQQSPPFVGSPTFYAIIGVIVVVVLGGLVVLLRRGPKVPKAQKRK